RPGGGGAVVCRRLKASTTATATPTTTSARTIRAQCCQRMLEAECRPHVRHRELDEGFAIELILLQRERDVDGGFVLGQVVVPLRRPPRDRAEDPPLLLERHLQVPFLE